jgi:hypothetical protein
MTHNAENLGQGPPEVGDKYIRELLDRYDLCMRRPRVLEQVTPKSFQFIIYYDKLKLSRKDF